MGMQHVLVTPIAGLVLPSHQAPTDDDGVGSVLCIYRSEPAATPGSPADTYFWARRPYEYVDGIVPYSIRVIDVIVQILTPIGGGATIQLRNATGPKSEAFDASAAGIKRCNMMQYQNLEKGEQLIVRRSDGGVVFEIFVLFMKI